MSSSPPAQSTSFDVYAKAFVPEFLLAINRAYALHTFPVRDQSFHIDFAKYVRSFSGTDFLEPLAPEASNFPPQKFSKARVFEQLTPSSYQEYFAQWMRVEHRALQSSQTQYDLHKIALSFSRAQKNSMTVLHADIVVPGLSENSPFVRVGDIVHLRPLFFDIRGEALKYAQSYERGSFIASPLYLPGWKGDLFHAEVIAVQRHKETITIRLNLTDDNAIVLQQERLGTYFNVQFPPRESLQAALWRAVQMASSSFEPHARANSSAGINELTGRQNETWLQKMLFPETAYGKKQLKLNSMHFSFQPIDSQLNREQLRAVESVIKNNYGAVPFLIHGPPGTGKTKTMVEIALQLLRSDSARHILICAPSDPAADTLTERLRTSLTPDELFRLNSPSRTFVEVADGLMAFCCIEDNHFSIPPFRTMMKYKVVITTCRDADLLVQARLTNRDIHEFSTSMLSILQDSEEMNPDTPLHWQALLIDEAAQATEPESLIPLTLISPPALTSGFKEPIFVMAGDQQQLGPRTASHDPIIRRSLFDRLLSRPLYAEHPLARHRLGCGVSAMRPLTKAMLPIIRPPFSNLLRNYRSHPAILAVPNALFYHDTLSPEAVNTDSLLGWRGWKGTWPVMFSQNIGHDEIEKDGGGWYNMTEVKKACEFASSLLQSGLVYQNDICVMSPFSAQVRRLRITFRKLGMQWVNIGPMEAFQGLESRVVILCTTRSRSRFLDQDKSRGFGIIHEPKRLNVAITRAKHGLIVIGNQEVLSIDPHWRAFLDFCIRNDLFDGRVGEDTLSVARGAPIPYLERVLKEKAQQPETTLLGITGELDDDMWIRGVTDGISDDEDEDDEHVDCEKEFETDYCGSQSEPETKEDVAR
ncbi:uncharacterized protein PV09_04871 [Verruconis gallopava]|uniref:Uncharacterized protein n=1 Tax=Verruconis gallopava TaxID=253628 RepID=A0A0D1YTT6_9PEZI|nr:uncharacterized protein PV09_04871 [Verruconis gallopava]KIW04052.1 hypothetical protein PV09_04871 [Verruconis gallopava]